jgi:hypothetical protein
LFLAQANPPRLLENTKLKRFNKFFGKMPELLFCQRLN